jgi:hypothetical protein
MEQRGGFGQLLRLLHSGVCNPVVILSAFLREEPCGCFWVDVGLKQGTDNSKDHKQPQGPSAKIAPQDDNWLKMPSL